MSEIKIIYWSGTGNTEEMAKAVAAGIEKAGGAAEVTEISDASAKSLENDTVFALGCPAMGAEVLEEELMEPFMEELDHMLEGKKVGLFGSYGWGDGEWMRDWEERIKEHGAQLINNEGVICCEAPDQDALEQCERLGEALAKAE
ncbi:flavodoxin [Murimonas intestini]|uniref:flavodoxin n=1 Tax=Murimonas intestini TaxID=1337051 RepID=UPI0011DD8D4E|nr:flavodoxin [Murimonas intestini]